MLKVLLSFLLMLALVFTAMTFPSRALTEDYTTTSYAPWWSLYHLTSPEEVNAHHKGGDGGQMIWAMAVAPSNPQKLLYGTDTSGIWRSDDGGTTWKISTTGLKTLGTVDIAYHPDNANVAYAASCLHDVSVISHVNSNVGIYKTTDGGATWNQVLQCSFYRLQSNKIIKFGSVNAQGHRTIYAGTHSTGVYKSEDSGATWTNLGRTGDRITDLYVNGSTIVEVSKQSGVMVSTNGGSTWTARNTGLPNVNVTSLAVNPNDTQMWFAVLDSQTVYKSTNAGLNWVSAGGLGGVTGTFMKLLFGAYNPGGNPVLYLTLNANSNMIRYSRDLGATWSTPAIDNSMVLRKDNTGYWAESTTVHPTDPYTVWTCLDGVVYKSTNTSVVSWSPSNSGGSGFRIKKIIFDNNGDIAYAGMTDHGMLKAASGYTTTEYPPFNHLTGAIRYAGGWSVHDIAVDPSNSNIVYAKVGNWGSDLVIEKSTNGGTTWTQLSGTAGNYGDFLEYHPQNNQVIYGGKLRSTNNGSTWTQLTYPVQAVYKPNGDIVYSATQTTIYKSTDRGSTWTTLATGLNGIQKITADYAVPNRLWVGTFSSGIIRLDGSTPTYIGQSHGLIPSVNGNICIFHVAQDPNNPQHFVAGGVDNVAMGPGPGLFESTNGGASWSLVPNTPGICDIWQVQFHKTQPLVYLCTSNGLLVYDWTKRGGATPTPTATPTPAATPTATATPAPTPTPPAGGYYFYNDSLNTDFTGYSGNNCVTNYNFTSVVHGGASAISNQVNSAWGYMQWTKNSGAVSTAGYSGIKLWVYGAGSSKEWKFRIVPTQGGSPGLYKYFTTTNGAWTEVTATWEELGNPASIYQIGFQENTGTGGHTTYFDEVRMYSSGAPTPTPTPAATPTATPTPTPTPAAGSYYFYNDSLTADFTGYSGNNCVTNYNFTSVVHGGASTISNQVNSAWGYMQWTKNSGALSTAGYSGIKLWVYGAGSSKEWKFRIVPTQGGSPGLYKYFTTTNGAWTEVTATWEELGNPASIYQIGFQENTGTGGHTTYFDEVRMY